MMKAKFKTAIILFLLFFTSFVFLFLSKEFISNIFAKASMDALNINFNNSKILVIAPHNDDETLSASILMKKAVESKCNVHVVFMTNGDGFRKAAAVNLFNIRLKPSDYIKFGYIRQKETIKALSIIGINDKDIIFLGYPDGGINKLWNYNWNKDEPFTSPYTRCNKSPYSNTYDKSSTYCGEDVVKNLEEIILKYKPDYIIFPHPSDRHPDHYATYCFVKYALTDLKYDSKELLYLVHRGDWPAPLKKDPYLKLIPPAKLINTGTQWYYLNINKNEQKLKYKAIHSYKTQIKVLFPLMNAFIRKNELFGELKNERIISFENNDINIIPNKENKITFDPTGDEIKLQISKSSDIKGVYAEISKEDNLHLFLELNSNVNKYINYNFNIFFFNDIVKRLNVSVENNKIILKTTSNNSISNINGITFSKKGRIIHIRINKSIIGEFNHMFININTSINGQILDNTAWTMVDMK